MKKPSVIKKFLNARGIYYMKGATSYELQIGKRWWSWCFLKGGYYKHWWQLNRFEAHKEQE